MLYERCAIVGDDVRVDEFDFMSSEAEASNSKDRVSSEEVVNLVICGGVRLRGVGVVGSVVGVLSRPVVCRG